MPRDRRPRTEPDYAQLWFKGRAISSLTTIGAWLFLGLVFVVVVIIADRFSDRAGEVVLLVMLGAPWAITLILLPLAIYRAFVPKMTPHERWLARKAAKPWPDPTPWKAKNPLDLGPYRVAQTRTGKALQDALNRISDSRTREPPPAGVAPRRRLVYRSACGDVSRPRGQEAARWAAFPRAKR